MATRGTAVFCSSVLTSFLALEVASWFRVTWRGTACLERLIGRDTCHHTVWWRNDIDIEKTKQNCSQGTVWDCADDNRWVINVWPPVHICYLKVVILSQVSAQKISVGLSVDNFWSLKILACGRLLAGGAVVYSSSCGLLKQWQHLWCHIYSVPPKRFSFKTQRKPLSPRWY